MDRIVHHGHLSMGVLRDTISQNNLKLSDLLRLRELLTGDLLLRLDRKLASELDGIYHRGPIYLRASHRLSSLAFGTQFGRILSRYIALPFGGSLLLVETVRHLIHFLAPHPSAESTTGGDELAAAQMTATTTAQSLPLWEFSLMIFGIGLFFLVLIESAGFRSLCYRFLVRLGNRLVYLFREFPNRVMKLPVVRSILESAAYRTLINYFVKPALLASAGLLLIDRVGHWWAYIVALNTANLPEGQTTPPPTPHFDVLTWNRGVIVFLIVNLFLNSPLGRYTDAMVTDQVRRGWRKIQMRVFSALFRFLVDSFQWILKTLEQVIYTVDELLRFRSGEHWYTLMFKAIVGVFWSVISYVVRFYITLLIEPQINPIKHFPVVTVSHKMILPFGPTLFRVMVAPLSPFVGAFVAGTIATSTVFLLPGVFGFLAWELKENWRLYASNRSRNLKPIPIGSHGETMVRLLRPGFHSGTVPKLFGRLRRASRRAVKTGNWTSLRKNFQYLQHIEEAIGDFIERELMGLLRQLPNWKFVSLRVAQVDVATNEVEVLVCARVLQTAP